MTVSSNEQEESAILFPSNYTNLIQESSTKVDRQVEIGVGIVHNVSIRGPHDFTNSFPILIEYHDWGTTLICSYIVLVAINLSKNEVTTVVIHQ